jgi:hypothetical protein
VVNFPYLIPEFYHWNGIIQGISYLPAYLQESHHTLVTAWFTFPSDLSHLDFPVKSSFIPSLAVADSPVVDSISSATLLPISNPLQRDIDALI